MCGIVFLKFQCPNRCNTKIGGVKYPLKICLQMFLYVCYKKKKIQFLSPFEPKPLQPFLSHHCPRGLCAEFGSMSQKGQSHNFIVTYGMTLQVRVFQCWAHCGETVPAGHSHSRAALSRGNVCGAKPCRIPLEGVVKLAEYRSTFIFYIFKTPPVWGIIFFIIISSSSSATACFDFHIKH